MARYDRGFGGQGGFRPRGGDWGGYDDDYGAYRMPVDQGRGYYGTGPGTMGGGAYGGGPNHYGGRGGYGSGVGPRGGYGPSGRGFLGGSGNRYEAGQGGGTFGSGHFHGGGGGYGGDYQAQQGGYTYGGGPRQRGPGLMSGGPRSGGAMYGGSLERWGGGGYNAYDRGIHGEEYPGPASGPGPRGGTGYMGGGRASQGRGYDRGWGGEGQFARAPFMPEEAYRRHPEYDQLQHSQVWDAYDFDEEEDLSDDDVREWVRRRMASDAWLDPERIEVEVEDGVVTLTGEVDDFLEARYAWDDAWESPGVLGVVNNLTVRTDLAVETHGDVVPQSSGQRPDLEPGGATES